MVATTILCALACAALVLAERGERFAPRLYAKTTASLAFVATSALAARHTWHPGYARWMIVGLVLGVAGDLALLGGKRAFLVGLGAFLFGHLAYLVAIAQLVPPRAWLAEAGALAALPLAVGVGALVVLWPRLGNLRLPVIGYVLAIVTMVIAAIAAARTAGAPDGPAGPVWQALPARNAALLVAGASAFFASDLAVARDRFVARTFPNKAWGLPAYYAGQLLLAWSLAAG